jgi:Subtilase family/WD domain, G-beta repeat
MAAITVLAVVAGFQWLRAERQRQTAAQAFKSEAEVTAKLHEQLRQASWASFNQAERQFQLGEWREGIALRARAIKFDPENQVASERFFHELIVHREKALPSLIASFEHQDLVFQTAFSPDGARILTASAGHTAKLWNAASGELIAPLGHEGEVVPAGFSPDGARILTGSADHTAKLWDAASGELIASFDHQEGVFHVAFSPDGARILTPSWDKTAKLWDAASSELIGSFAHQDGVWHAAFISMSLGGLTIGPDVPSTYTIAVIDALRLGIPVVTAIGNEGSQTSGSPGNDLFAFAVGATDSKDRVAGFSGGRTQIIFESAFLPPEALPLPYSKPDLTAPGVAVFSSVPDGKWEHFNGTSMATPHVAGAIALLLAATSLRKNIEKRKLGFTILDLLAGSVEELGESGQDHRYGFGRLDVLRAIGFAREMEKRSRDGTRRFRLEAACCSGIRSPRTVARRVNRIDVKP